jgi:polysaccharide biosynthesis/export protein
MKFKRLISLTYLLYVGSFTYSTYSLAQLSINNISENAQLFPTYSPLKTGDRVAIRILGFPDLSGEQNISADGSINLPLVGRIEVLGLSSESAAERIANALLPYVRRPQVSLTLVTPSSLRISVTGEVLNPGPRSILLSEENSNTVRLSDALIAAGGITPNANLRSVTIRRQPQGVLHGLESLFAEVDLWEAIQTGNLSKDPIIFSNDEIVVPRVQGYNPDQATLLSSTIAPTTVSVSVAGEVYRPGQVQIPPSADITAAIAAAGGPTRNANTRSITLFRISPTGQLRQQSFSLGAASTTILNGDVIIVRRSMTSNILNFLGDIASPIRVLLEVIE